MRKTREDNQRQFEVEPKAHRKGAIRRFAAALAALLLAAPAARAADSAPMRLDLRPSPRVAADGEDFALAYSPRWGGAASCSIDADGVRVLANATGEGTVAWTARGVGRHALALTAGSLAYDAAFTVLGDDVVLHGGVLAAGETWGADKVHLLTAPLTIPSGVTLTIESGAVVKFMDGAGLSVESGGACVARGVVFTHVADDTAGGDTMMDGDETAPAMGAYAITGVVTDDDATEYRYMPPQTLTSSITADTRLRGHRCYIVSNSVTVASGATLTLQPGTILKFNTGCQMTVNGTLSALGTRAAPIVFTSLKDDEHGGDTNGDGEKTYAQPGDWYQIRVAGTAAFDYCSILYNASTENYGGLEAYGGTVTLDNSEIAHCKYECVNAHSSGTLTARNTAFWDGSLGFGYYGSGRVKAYNCVFQGLTTAIRQSGKQLVNCVFSDCVAFTDQGGDGSTFDHCVFWNPAGYGAQSYSKAGASGNIWGDPLFLDADAGDFRIAANSPCVDAADSSAAPATDYWGQPRVTVRYSPTGTPDALGRHADIGIHESLPENAAGIYDLAAVSVSASATSAAPGETIAVSWTVANSGKRAVPDSWHDALSLVNAATGKAYPLGEPLNPGVLDAGAERTFTATFAVPVAPDGAYRLRLTVNSRRAEVPEGAATANNAVLSDGEIAIAVAATAAADGAAGSVAPGSAQVVAFDIPADSGDLLLRVTAPAGGAGLSARTGLGFQPTDAGSGTALAFANGEAWLMVPAGTERVYLVLENGGAAAAAFAADFRAGSLSLASVSPSSLPAGGSVTLQIAGAGFGDGCEVLLGGSATAVAAVRCVSAGLIAATIDCAKLAKGAALDLAVKKGAEVKTLQKALKVSTATGTGRFWAKLSVPESVREGRLVQTCFVEYGNDGTADMASPVLQVVMEGNGTLGYVDGLSGQNTLQFVAAGGEGSAGVLRPGETRRIRFALRAGSNNRISLRSSVGSAYAPTPWTTAADYISGLSAAATRIGLRGQDPTDYEEVLKLARAVKNGERTAAICGKLVDCDGAGMTGVLLAVSNTVSSALLHATTGEGGFFSTGAVEDGEYAVLCPGVPLAGEFTAVVSDDADAVLSIEAANVAIVGVSVKGGTDGLAAVATEIKTLTAHVGRTVEGGFEFRGLPDGSYRVEIFRDDILVFFGRILIDEGEETVAMLEYDGATPGTLELATDAETAMAGAAFLVMSGDSGFLRFAAVDEETGGASLMLPAGEYEVLLAFADSEEVPSNTVVVASGATASVRLSPVNAASAVSAKAGGARMASASMARSGADLSETALLKVRMREAVAKARELAAVPLNPPSGDRNCIHNRESLYPYYKSYRDEFLSVKANFEQTFLDYEEAEKAYIFQNNRFWTGAAIVGLKAAVFKAFPIAGVAYTGIETAVDTALNGASFDTFCGMLEIAGVPFASNAAKWRNKAKEQYGLIRDFASRQSLQSLFELHKAAMQNHNLPAMELSNQRFEQFLIDNDYYAYWECCPMVLPETPYQPPVETVQPNVPQSCDPNEMAGPLGTGAERAVLPGDWCEYTIYFENQTNATAAASEVRVTAQLDPQLDWSSFKMVAVSFGDQTDPGLEGDASGTSECAVPGTNYTVRSEVTLDAETGAVSWYLRIVDPDGDDDGWPLDPAGGFLPPNDPETHCGEGHITYRVKVRGDARENARIDAAATIVFDYNDPIETDPAWWNTVAWRSYAVKFNANGGTGTMAAQRIDRDVAAKLSANTFARSGHTFIGWSKSKSGNVAYANKAAVKNLADAGESVTLFAQWAKTAYKVAFNANGGTLPKGKKMAAQALTYGKAAKLRKNVFTRKDCVFLGWSTSKSGKVLYANAAAVKNLRRDGKTTTLFARWAKKNYTVAFNANGGTGAMAKQTMTYNKAARLRKNAFKRSGWTFLGWATSKTGKVAYKNAAAVKNLRSDGKTTTLFAVWAKTAYKVAFNANGGTGAMAAQTMTYNKAAALRKNAFKRTGYTFAGWATSKSGEVAYKNAAAVKNLRSDGKTTTLFAKWTATTYRIAFDANGGAGTMAAQSVKYDATAILRANAFTREGFTFQGWSKSASGGMAYAEQASVKNLKSDGGTVTLYAVWAEEPASETDAGVPRAWLAHYGRGDGTAEGYEAAAAAKAANGVNTLAECYVAGLDPTDENAAFVAEIAVVEGKVVVSSEPEGVEGRAYVVEAKRDLLEAAWTDVTDHADPASEGWRFFRVRVKLAE